MAEEDGPLPVTKREPPAPQERDAGGTNRPPLADAPYRVGVGYRRVPMAAPRREWLERQAWRGGPPYCLDWFSAGESVSCPKTSFELPNSNRSAARQLRQALEECRAGRFRVARRVRTGGDTGVDKGAELLWDTPGTYPVGAGGGCVGAWVGWWVCPCHSGEWNRYSCRCGRGDEQFLEHVLLLSMIASATAHMGIVVRARCDEPSSALLQSRPTSARYYLVLVAI